MKKNKTYSGKAEQTLCWMCAKSCGQCSWSERFEPVDGWDAEKCVVNFGRYGREESYLVRRCPEFVHEGRHRYTDLDEEGMKRLAQRVLIRSARDYREAVEDLEELRTMRPSCHVSEMINNRKSEIDDVTRSLRGGSYIADILGADGDAMLDALERSAAGYRECGEWR